jgi:hypothetical protein
MCGEARKVSLDRGFDQMRNNIFRGRKKRVSSKEERS